MKVNISKLKGKIVENNMTQEVIAKEIGMHRTTFYRKMQDKGVDFTLQEVWGMTEKLNLDPMEMQEIFLNNE